MKVNLGRQLLLSAALILPLLLLTACAAGAPAAAPAAGADNPPAAAPAPAAIGAMPPVVDAELLADFAAAQQAINADWDAFHTDFDAWRAGLTSCDRSAVQTALREFAGDFGGIYALAQALPSSGITRGLAYPAIDAAAIEGALLRQYRDNWQPGNTALAEEFQIYREDSAFALRQTAEELDELGERDDPEQRAAAQALADALEPISAAWETAHQDYAALSRQQAEIAPVAEVSAQVSDLIKVWNADIIEPLQKLESDDDAVADIADELIETAQGERDALAELRDGIDQRDQELSAPEPGGMAEDLAAILELESAAGNGAEPPDSAQEQDEMAEPEPPPEPEPVDNSDLFAVMTAEVEIANEIRKENRRALDKLIEGIKESDRQALADFTAALARLQREWDEFHSDYDEWVSAAGGCDQAAAAQALAQFQQRFNQLGARVRGLSQASYLRPTSDLLAAAAAGEGAALRGLVSSWRPYAADGYRALDRERAQADNLRRQADRRTAAALERYGGG